MTENFTICTQSMTLSLKYRNNLLVFVYKYTNSIEWSCKGVLLELPIAAVSIGLLICTVVKLGNPVGFFC